MGEREINPPRSFVGRIEAMQTVDLRPQVEGILRQQLFTEGSDIQTGNLLYVIEPGRYQAALAATEANRARAEASLKEAELTLARNEKLLKSSIRFGSSTPSPRTGCSAVSAHTLN